MIETGRWINRYTINLYFTPLRHPKKTPTFDVKKKTHSKKQSFWYKEFEFKCRPQCDDT